MGLEIALTNALSGLRTNQSALEITSNNVTNAQVDGYSRQIVSPQSLTLNGQGAGVQLGPISRNVSQQLIDAVRDESSTQAFAQTLSDQLGLVQEALGNPSDDTSIASRIANLAAAYQSLATTPFGTPQKSQVVVAAQRFAQTLNGVATNVQQLRGDADQQIQNAVADASTQLNTIQQLNAQIAQLQSVGQSTAELEDQRDVAVKKLASELDITTVKRGDGTMGVYTKSGVTLLDRDAPIFTHTAVGNVSPTINYPGGFNGIMLNGVDITTQVTGGKIGALLQLRDTTLPNLSQQFDALAGAAISQINAIHNDGASVPAPNSLTSTASVNTTDAFTGTGTVRIAITDQNGNAVAAPLDLDLSTVVPATVAGLLTAINTGLGANATASVTNGHLVITASNSANGIAINQQGTDVGGSGKGFSSYFGMNDLFVANAAVSSALTISVRSDIVANPAILATGTLTTGALAAGGAAVPPGDNSVVQAIANAFNTAISLPAAGGLAATTSTLGDYASQIIGGAALQAASANDNASFESTLLQNLQNKSASISGVNVDEELANLTMYQNAYAASARVITVINSMFQTLNAIGT
jgi:flagellar hook-associated protein 1 FlgK